MARNKILQIHPSQKLSLYLLSLSILVFIILFQIKTLQNPFLQCPQINPNNTTPGENSISMAKKVEESVTFLPLKDLRYSNKPQEGHTWFMSSIHDTHEKGEVQFQEYPSKPSKGRVLCLKGGDTHDGSWNSYALAWPNFLPPNSTLIPGLTFISYNHYNYHNIWHGLSAAVPFVMWHLRNACLDRPARWVLYHWGEVRSEMGDWLRLLMEAAFDVPVQIEKLDRFKTHPACFEKAVVMRHNEGGMSRERRVRVYDFLKCKARVFCNVTDENRETATIGMTMLMRTGARSFRNESAVIEIFDAACRKVPGCRLTVAYANNLSFCQQVKLMRWTDVLVSAHGAQLTNMFLMERNSSVMEFFPGGWLKLAGIGQYVYQWMASWSGMNHRGAWRDPRRDNGCGFPEDDRRCMSVYKNARIGHNQSYFGEWAGNVLTDVVKTKKSTEKKMNVIRNSICLVPTMINRTP